MFCCKWLSYVSFQTKLDCDIIVKTSSTKFCENPWGKSLSINPGSEHLQIFWNNLTQRLKWGWSCELHGKEGLEGTTFHAYTQKGNSSTKSLAYTTLVRPILEYGAACWDPYREGQIHALERMQKEAAKFAYHMNESNWVGYIVAA